MTTAEREEIVAGGAMSIAAAAKFTGLSRSGLYKLMDRGELAYIKIGRARRVPKRAIERLLSDNLVGGGTAEQAG